MYRKTELENGIRIVTEEVPSFHSVSMGVNVAVGSRFESVNEAGYSHFLEHMLFKGTPRRAAAQIAREIEAVGGILNAFTTREYTSYYCKVLEENFDGAVDLLTDIFLHSTFDPDELNREREVVKEELRMTDDNPDELVADLFYRSLFPNHPLGLPILGSFASLDKLDRKSVMDYRDKYYQPGNVVISAAGRVDHDRLVALVEKAFEGVSGTKKLEMSAPQPFTRKSSFHHKATEQVHVCLGTMGYSYGEAKRIPLLVLNTELGGGMGSRLFQEVREKRGLAYSVGSHSSAYWDTGILEVFLGTAKKNVASAIDVCIDIFQEMSRKPFTERELKEAKSQLKGGLLMSLESSDSRMGRMARNEMYLNRFVTVVDLIEQIDRVTIEEVQAAAIEVLNPDRLVLTMLGDEDQVNLPTAFQIQ